MSKKMSELSKSIGEGLARSKSIEADIELERQKVEKLRTSTAESLIGGADLEVATTELEHAEKRMRLLVNTNKMLLQDVGNKQKDLEDLRLQDAQARQTDLKTQADAAILEYVKAQKAAWEASLKLAQLARQEQAGFCGPFRLDAQIDGGRWSNEAAKIESYIGGNLSFSDPDLLLKAGLSNSEMTKIKAQLE